MHTRCQSVGVRAARCECEVVADEGRDFRQVCFWVGREEENEVVECVFRVVGWHPFGGSPGKILDLFVIS
jgi:hypothetical protein